MASMSPDMAQEERLLEQMSKLSKQTENPVAEPLEADGMLSRHVISAHKKIPVTRHTRADGKLMLQNGWQKSFKSFVSGAEAKINGPLERLPIEERLLAHLKNT